VQAMTTRWGASVGELIETADELRSSAIGLAR
jgi:hypothetical protein